MKRRAALVISHHGYPYETPRALLKLCWQLVAAVRPELGKVQGFAAAGAAVMVGSAAQASAALDVGLAAVPATVWAA